MQRLSDWAQALRQRREATWRARLGPTGGGDWPSRVIYFSPDQVRPTGGIKVIYRHVEALRHMGVDAYVMHEAKGFHCNWFESSAPVLHFKELRPGDRVVLPEVMPHFADRMRLRGVPYSIFVQNAYLALEVSGFEATRDAYQGSQAVLAISDDSLELLQTMMSLTVPMLRVQASVDARRFVGGDKQPLVTYMPRKMPQHARLVTSWLAAEHPDWRFLALEGMTENEIAAALNASMVFLAFSEYEGLALPPIEAALAGNLVLGYGGWGAGEFWATPLFHGVPFGDVRAFVHGFAELSAVAEAGPSPIHRAAREALALRFSAAAEAAKLRAAAVHLGWLPT